MRICGFSTCVCLQVVFIGIAAEARTPRKGTACASDAASGCKPEFSHGSGSGASAHA